MDTLPAELVPSFAGMEPVFSITTVPDQAKPFTLSASA